MNFAFKLSRRLARFKIGSVVAGSLLTLACSADGPNGPGSDPISTDPAGVSISPKSAIVGVNEAIQFQASTDTALASSMLLSASKGGKGRGRGRSAVVDVSVSPHTYTVAAGSTASFSATATLSDGSTTPAVTWSAGGGTIDSNGMYTAGSVTGNYSVVARAANGVADSAAVVVSALAPQVVRISLSPTSASLPVGGRKHFSALGTSSAGDTVAIALAYTATGGTISAAGDYTAGSIPGSYRVIAADSAKDMADTSTVFISAPTVTAVTLTPATISLAPSGTQQFTATGTMSDGSTGSIATTFTATGGTVSSSGLYTAGATAGTYRVIATDPGTGKADTSAVTIVTVSAPTVTAVKLTPATVSLAPSGTQQFTATGTMSDGSTGSIAPTFTATGGTVSSSGLYTAGAAAGTYRVIATDPGIGKADTSVVTIAPVASAVASVTVSPSSASLTSGQTSQLTASVRDSSGTVLSGQTVSWTSSNTNVATVSSTGLVTGVGAGNSTITAASGGKQGQAAIGVTSPPTSTASGCPTSGYTRLVSVSTQTQLVAAINGALAGDQIRLAAGTYRGGFQTSRNGTSSDPITLCGPRTAIVDNGGGYVAHRADWWVYRGFTITNGLFGIRTEGASRNVFDSLLIEGIGQEAIELVQTSTYNTVTRSTIRETSTATDWAEGIYVGVSTGNDPSNNNRIIGNWFGPNLRAEHIQLNPGTSGTVVSDNHMDATGMPFKSGIISSIVGVFGSSNNTWTGNVITNVGNGSLSGFFVYESGSTNNVFHSNTVAGTFSYGFRMNGGGGNVVGCDNVESGTGALANVACQ